MNKENGKNGFSTDNYYFKDTPFHLLMQKRVREVLLVCSVYDAYILEEDGRIEEQIFNEYVSLNLRYPPHFTRASSTAQAFEILDSKNIDLIITMLEIGDSDAFELARKIKLKHPGKPVVVLTYFSREIKLKLEKEDLSSIDYVFTWLGNSSIILAIVKLIEDRMNVANDVQKTGVQTIILIEDSIRYYSTYLPMLYTILFKQSLEVMSEGLNAHQKTMRMRGRPKILLANNYEEALSQYHLYGKNVLGVISDISFKKGGRTDREAGLKLAELIRENDKDIPILLQSSRGEHKEPAERMQANFLHKHSKHLLMELREFFKFSFGFGEFIFKDPATMAETGRAANLKQMQEVLKTIPRTSVSYHAGRNHFSRWLRTRAIFSLAELLRSRKVDEFDNLEELTTYIIEAIKNYRKSINRGIVSSFEKKGFDEISRFARIGEGSLGGKARSLAFIDYILTHRQIRSKYNHVEISIPQSVVIATDIFDEFLESNNLYKIALSERDNKQILAAFLKAKLPPRITEDLRIFLKINTSPLAIRSSSLLEDSHYQPFAGIYATYMIANNGDLPERTRELAAAIKAVYASTFYKDSKSYMEATGNVVDEEKMAVIIQKIAGSVHNNRFYPTISGVARSINFYPMGRSRPEDGVVNIAFGLGKTIVDGEVSLRFCPTAPAKTIQLSSIESSLKSTQTSFYSLDLTQDHFIPQVIDSSNLQKLHINDALPDGTLTMIASSYDHQNNVIRDNVHQPGAKIITFSRILKKKSFPLAEILSELLEMIDKSMNKNVEIEFAVELSSNGDKKKHLFNLLQARPLVRNLEKEELDLSDVKKEDTIAISNAALGNGRINSLHDIIYVKPEEFNPARTQKIAKTIEKLNAGFSETNSGYILIGPGRWGSFDDKLGIPVKWCNISHARLIVEASLINFMIEPSQGSHFFQNITSFKIGYFTINPFNKVDYYDLDYLRQAPCVYEDENIRHVRFKQSLVIKINGRENRGIVYKPVKSD